MSVCTDSFEMMLMAAMVRDVKVYNKTVGIIDDSMMSSSMNIEFLNIIRKFVDEHRRVPTQLEISHLYKRDRNVGDDTALNKYLDMLYNYNVDGEFVISELNKYSKMRKMEGLMKTSYEKLKMGNDIDISTMVSDMFRIQMSTLNNGKIYGVNLDDAEHLINDDINRTPIPTNIRYLNETINGGLSGGQLGIILAPPNYGKTMTLLNFALYAWMKGSNVLFVTLEMKEFSILKRALMIVSGALKVKTDMNTIKAISDKTGKKFTILYKPVKTISVDYLYSVYHQAEADNVKFDAVYIDYADLLISKRTYKEKRFELSDIFDALKAFAQILNIPVWSATQANRAGLRAETVTMEHISEDISKAFISDIILSLNEKVNRNSTVKFYLTKHREGRSNVNIDTYVNENMYFELTDNIHADLSKI